MTSATRQPSVLPPHWECNPHELVSLEDMLKVYAGFYIKIGESLLSNELNVTEGQIPEAAAQPEELQAISESLNGIKEHCVRINLMVSSDVISQYQKCFSQSITTWAQVSACFKHIRMTIVSELRSRLFLQVLPQRRRFYNSNQEPGAETGSEIRKFQGIFENFSSIRYDISEAGNCFAFERFTACVYHLMRAAEYGLVSVARSIGVPSERLTSWDNIIRGIQERIKTEESSNPKTPNWQERRKLYSELCSWFTDIKNGWRNPVSHVPRVYSEDDASGMFAATRNLFLSLIRQGLAQVEMPATAITLPDEEKPSGQGHPR